jgi:hypothetical protein
LKVFEIQELNLLVWSIIWDQAFEQMFQIL